MCGARVARCVQVVFGMRFAPAGRFWAPWVILKRGRGCGTGNPVGFNAWVVPLGCCGDVGLWVMGGPVTLVQLCFMYYWCSCGACFRVPPPWCARCMAAILLLHSFHNKVWGVGP